MDGNSYINIFETKGIEYLLTILFFSILIPFWIILNKQVKIKKQIQKVLGILTSKSLRIPQGLFFSKNHTWTHLEKSGLAKVGMDDLLQHLTGEVNFTYMKDAGEMVKKGDVLTEVDQNGKKLQILSPISGKLEKANESLAENPEFVNEDPYGKGWMYKIKPTNWISETNSYYMADEATKWESDELVRFKDFISQTLAKSASEPSMVTLQDGGELRDNTLSELPDEVWRDFQKEFMNTVV